nr:MAG TPA: hypothetical protein [Caudoviricetes sp.]
MIAVYRKIFTEDEVKYQFGSKQKFIKLVQV